jgi:RTX calcium-binding nonapeptide repeat (4 copies)
LRRLPIVLAAAAVVTFAWPGDAGAKGTASANGPALVYTGDGAPEHMSIDKEPVYDTGGNIAGSFFLVGDARGGGAVTAAPPCEQQTSKGARCPPGSSIFEVNLGGGNDSFVTQDWTLGKGFRFGSSCTAVQAVAAVRLDGGPGSDLIEGSRLADTLVGGAGGDGLTGWDGDDRLSGGPGIDLLEGEDGRDVIDGGSGGDVIHLDGNPLSRDSCFRQGGRPFTDVGRGGLGNDAITGVGGGDRLEGGPGNDEMSARGGHDKLLGGAGRDRIFSLDGRSDWVDCGPGDDLLEASDRSDRVRGCETRFLRPR